MIEMVRFAREAVEPSLDSYVRILEAMPADADLAMELSFFTDRYRDTGIESHLRVRIAALWTKVATWAEAQALTDVGAGAMVAEATDAPVEMINFVADVGLETGLGEGWAGRQVDLGRQLLVRLPEMAAALGRAALGVPHARALLRALDTVDDAAALRIDARLTPRAVENRWTPPQLAAAARRMVMRLDPDGGAERHDRGLDEFADVVGGAMTDGLGWLAANGDAVTIADILQVVDERAEQLQRISPDTPTGRARFAALGDLLLGDGFTLFDHVMGAEVAETLRSNPADSSPTGQPAVQPAARRRRSRREVVITIDLPTLLGLRDNPAEIAGLGPIPARLARLIAEDATVRRMVTDPVTGEALDLDRRNRFPTDTLVTAIRATQQTCRFPGCTRARRPELDHRDDWLDGGATEPRNLQLLCRRHHALKTAGLWKAELAAEGSIVWTGPDGQRRVRGPDDPLDHPDTS